MLLVLSVVHAVAATVDVGGLICRLPRSAGYACHISPHSAFFFDSDTRRCVEFLFKGCGGNANRFATEEECAQGCRSMTRCEQGTPIMDASGNIRRCDGDRVPCPGSHICTEGVCCYKPERICRQPVHTGIACGVPVQTRYYFDSSANICRPFAFSGCGGNENNFRRKGSCASFCSSSLLCPMGDPYPDKVANKPATCQTDGHCPLNHTCASPGGVCCPSKEYVCGTAVNMNTRCQNPSELLWTFDYMRGACVRVETPACPQLNAFANREQCVEYCMGSCPRGTPHINSFTQQPQLCDSQTGKGCPVGFECLASSPYTWTCCRVAASCPGGSIALVEEGKHVRCDENPCPGGYECHFSSNREGVCCSPRIRCPPHLVAVMENGIPRLCSGDWCPLGARCLPSLHPSGVRNVCCLNGSTV